MTVWKDARDNQVAVLWQKREENVISLIRAVFGPVEEAPESLSARLEASPPQGS